MAFSMHSHSGEFCSHGADTLEAVVLRAIERGMEVYALTEHMPRAEVADLYPEEIESHTNPQEALSSLGPLFNAYLSAAQELRDKYADRITLLIGFESELIRQAGLNLIHSIFSNANQPVIDFWVGSVHHVRGHPIDFDRTMYEAAVKASGNAWSGRVDGPLDADMIAFRAAFEEAQRPIWNAIAEECCWEEYFDTQFHLIQAGKGRGLRVVGHFDLIRLFSLYQGGAGWREGRHGRSGGWSGVWHRVRRNLRAIVEAGMLLEVNTSGLRKGLPEPYPCRMVCEEFLAMGGTLTLSDDAHSVLQVGTYYEQAFDFLESLDVEALGYLERAKENGTEHNGGPSEGNARRTSTLVVKMRKLEDVRAGFK